MTQEDKELLLKDLCARLPYGVKVKHEAQDFSSTLLWVDAEGLSAGRKADKKGVGSDWGCIEFIKPYLRTMDSMTEEEVEEYRSIQSDIWKECGNQYYDNWRSIRWLYEHNFNVSLPEHLFIKVTKENNPYK